MNKVLIVAAHPDDEVLGCGATIAQHVKEGDEVQIVFLADGYGAREVGNNRDHMANKASKVLGCNVPIFLNFPDNQLDTIPLLEIIKEIEIIVAKFQPNIVYTHHFADLNIDHVIANKAVLTACRPLPDSAVKRILSFEIPSSTEWQFSGKYEVFNPNWFNNIAETFPLKIKALEVYRSEMRQWPHPRSFDSIEHLAKWRGSSVGIEFAEAFILLRNIS